MDKSVSLENNIQLAAEALKYFMPIVKLINHFYYLI